MTSLCCLRETLHVLGGICIASCYLASHHSIKPRNFSAYTSRHLGLLRLVRLSLILVVLRELGIVTEQEQLAADGLQVVGVPLRYHSRLVSAVVVHSHWRLW